MDQNSQIQISSEPNEEKEYAYELKFPGILIACKLSIINSQPKVNLNHKSNGAEKRLERDCDCVATTLTSTLALVWRHVTAYYTDSVY